MVFINTCAQSYGQYPEMDQVMGTSKPLSKETAGVPSSWTPDFGAGTVPATGSRRRRARFGAPRLVLTRVDEPESRSVNHDWPPAICRHASWQGTSRP